MSDLLIAKDTSIFDLFQAIADRQKMAFFAGLPGTGKSLFLKQCALIAEANGRTVHLLQYDVTRPAFETPEYQQKYPEVDGVTHPAIRKAVGLWARVGVLRWLRQFPGAEHLLLGEVPLIGNRLIELTRPEADDIEAVLNSSQTLFIIPVPSQAVRQHIENARKLSLSQPKHVNETKDAPLNVLHDLWQQVTGLALAIGLADTDGDDSATYDPAVYTVVYQYLLQHRHHQVLPIDTILQPSGSAYDLEISGTELAATAEEVTQVMTRIETEYTPESLATAVANWYQT